MKAKTATSRLRCAIYTRKSSDEGLEQNFNSLDAQREACEAYVLSQTGEGWSALPARYDDGGYSGGSMERPGLKQLLADIALKKVDIVVVYKVDRLTRSLADFAKIVEIFDAHGVSFVSVTQAFNTTTSMGRLTLNVLLSFAQFEREVTGERIRDKIAASKAKGMWMGGTAPLGYRPHERTLVIDETEAQKVRHIFSRYLGLGSVHALVDELKRDGIRSRPGKAGGDGSVFGRGPLYHLLSNRTYIGEIVHKDKSYPGQHPAIIDRETFEAAAKLLQAGRRQRGEHNVAAGRAPLTGLIFDAQGSPLSPVSARKSRDRIYRYYVSAHLQQGGKRAGLEGHRLPAPLFEELVLSRVRGLTVGVNDWSDALKHLRRVEVGDGEVALTIKFPARSALKSLDPVERCTIIDDDTVRVAAPMSIRRWAGRSEIKRPERHHTEVAARIDRTLVRGLGRAHALVAALKASPDRTFDEFGEAEGLNEAYIRRLTRIAFLAPDIQRAILDGHQPAGLTLERLVRTELPLAWGEQRQLLGFRN